MSTTPKTHLAAACRANKYKTRALARDVGISGPYMSQILNGQRGIPEHWVGDDSPLPSVLRAAAMDDYLAQLRRERERITAQERQIHDSLDNLRKTSTGTANAACL